MAERLSVILIEDAFLIQSGIQSLLNEFSGLKVKAVFDGSEKLLTDKVLAQKPDVLIVDPNSIKTELISFLRDLDVSKSTQIIGLVDSKTADNIVSRFQQVLNYRECKYDLLQNLKAILGKRISPVSKNTAEKELSEREKTILIQIVQGQTTQEIADELFLSIHTINTHRKNLTNKLGIKTVSGLTVYALINKLVDIRDIDHR